MKYEIQKKESENRKKTKKSLTKELRIGINIADHDYLTKINHAKSFIEEDSKVKFSMMLRGRQNIHKGMGIQLFEKIRNDVSEFSKIDSDIKNTGNMIFFVISPKK